MPAAFSDCNLRTMNKDSLEYLMHVYSVEDGNCFVTGPSWALRRNRVPVRARAVKATAAKPSSAKSAPGPRVRMVRRKVVESAISCVIPDPAHGTTWKTR